MKNLRYGRQFSFILSVSLFLFYWFFWGWRYGQYFYAAQDSGLFLFNVEFLREHLQRPGGAVRYLAGFVGQFFYYPALGAFLIACLLDVTRRLALRLFAREPKNPSVNAFVASLIPAALLTIGATWRGYSVFTPFEPTAPFVPTVGLLVAFAIAAFWRRVILLEEGDVKSILIVGCCCIVLLCFLMGRLGLLCGFLCVLSLVLRPIRGLISSEPSLMTLTYRAVLFAVMLSALYPFIGFWSVLGAALALLCERYVLSTTETKSTSDSSSVAKSSVVQSLTRKERRSKRARRNVTPKTNVVNDSQEGRKPNPRRKRALFFEFQALAILTIPTVWYWFEFYRRTTDSALFWAGALEPCLDLKDVQVQIAAGLTLFLLSAFSLLATWFGARQARTARSERSTKFPTRRVMLLALPLALPLIVWFGSFRSAEFFTLCRCARYLESEEWEKLLAAESRAPRPTGVLVGLRNAALFRLGLLGSKAFERPVDGERVTPPSGSDEPTALSAELALAFGQTNIATRAATYYLVQTDDRSARCLRTMALAALANGEDSLALKYAQILKESLFYRPLGQELADAAQAPADGLRYASSARLLRALRPKRDKFVFRYPFYPFLSDVCSDDWEDASGLGLDARLVNLLIERRVAEFGARLLEGRKARRLNHVGALPKHYQEALLVWGELGGAVEEEDARILDALIDVKTRDAFKEFSSWRDTVDFKNPDARRELFERYGDSYWGYYYDPLTSYAQRRGEGGEPR